MHEKWEDVPRAPTELAKQVLKNQADRLKAERYKAGGINGWATGSTKNARRSEMRAAKRNAMLKAKAASV